MKYLSDYTNEKQTQAFDEAGAFFAFSQKQFNEAKREGIEYCSMGAGLICPVENAKHLFDRLEKINKEGIAQDIQENGKKAIIRRELFNHECFYTSDITACVEKLEDYGYSASEIYQVYDHICQTEDVH